MKQILVLHNCNIEVLFREHSVHINNNGELWKLMGGDLESTTGELVQVILLQFQQFYHRKLNISADSLVVEIWGHVYFEYLALVLENLVKLKLLESVVEKMVSYCEVIDCGEHGHDSNRKLWDMLASFKSRIAGWLPKNINNENLKKKID